MDKVTLLCDMHKLMLEEFDQRVRGALRYSFLIRIMQRPVQDFLTINISNEIVKGRHIIEHAADLVKAGTFPTRQDIQHLLDMSRDIDQAMLKQGIVSPARLSSQLPLLEPIRRQYAQSLLNETHQLLCQWQGMTCLRNALALQYDVPQFSKLLYDMLHLYGLQTRLLCQALHLPGFYILVRESNCQTIYLAMDAVARQLASELAARLFRSHA
ncbi:MAG: hypothetical protein P8Z75_07000 [Gammaproteobacteria bacterium]|jgi:hypothetical protein